MFIRLTHLLLYACLSLVSLLKLVNLVTKFSIHSFSIKFDLKIIKINNDILKK